MYSLSNIACLDVAVAEGEVGFGGEGLTGLVNDFDVVDASPEEADGVWPSEEIAIGKVGGPEVGAVCPLGDAAPGEKAALLSGGAEAALGEVIGELLPAGLVVNLGCGEAL